MSFRRAYWLTIFFLAIPAILTASIVPHTDPLERVRVFTRAIEFDYSTWTLNALGIKLGELALGTSNYLAKADQSDTVLEALDLIRQVNELEAKITDIYADPSIINPELASATLRKELAELQARHARLEPLAEAILQDQINEIAATTHLTLGGQALPPVLFHITPPPDALIVSPRNVIRQDYDISISPTMGIEQVEALEKSVDASLNVSSLVVGIGGVGVYPTMVMETTDINGLAEVVAHEWIHNYLFLRPLGVSYMNSPELRVMNETVASIAGKELGKAVVARFYPQYYHPESSAVGTLKRNARPAKSEGIDFRAEMHETRVNVDRMLAEGKIETAESYMEMRRRYLWDNGYHIRKLNQAYFAFYGAYADQPGGAAGEDPVGAAVRLLRERSSSLADFINRISWMWKFDQLKSAVGNR